MVNVLSTTLIEHVARLANLPLSEDEIEKYFGQLSKILGHIEQLDKVNTSKVEPTFNVTGKANVTQEDVPSESLTQEEALQNAHSNKNGYFVTKGVFEE